MSDDPLLPDYAGPCIANVVPALLESAPGDVPWLPAVLDDVDRVVLLVLDVLPVSIPPDLSVDGGNDDAGDSDAVGASSVHLLPTQLLHGRGQCHPGSPPHANLIYKAADW